MHEECQIGPAPRSWISGVTVLCLVVAALLYGMMVYLELVPSLLLMSRARMSWPIVVSDAISVYCLAGIMLVLLHGWRAGTYPGRTGPALMLAAPMVAGTIATAVAFAKRSSHVEVLGRLVCLSPLLVAAVDTLALAVLTILTNRAIKRRAGSMDQRAGREDAL